MVSAEEFFKCKKMIFFLPECIDKSEANKYNTLRLAKANFKNGRELAGANIMKAIYF